MSKVTDIIIETKVDKDILDSLRSFYFGDLTDPLIAASSRAYCDMSRTIRFNGLSNSNRFELRERVNDCFKDEISQLALNSITSQENFDLWHRSLSEKIKNIYRAKDVNLTYGHAQKWINMTIKYLYMLEINTFDGIFEYLHIPVDNYVLDIAEESLGITKPTAPWSSWNDYEELYLKYQKSIRNKMVNETPLRWEFRHWLKAKKH